MNNNKIGKFIKTLREEKGITQDQLADALFVHRTLVNKWEKGGTTLTSEHLKALSNYFNISADELLCGERLTKTNESYIKETKYTLYDNSIKNYKKIKWLIFLCITILLSFLIYYFYTFYNSVRMYNISANDQINLTNGFLVKTRDYVALQFYIDEDRPITELTIFYHIDNQDVPIFSQGGNNLVYITDTINNQEIFSFANLDEILKNLYIKVKFANDEDISSPLNFYRIYTNTNIFFKLEKRKRLEPENKSTSTANTSLIFKKYQDVYNNFAEQGKIVKLDGQEYAVFILDNVLHIDYVSNGVHQVLTYSKFENEDLAKIIEDKLTFSCIINETCDDAQEELILLNKILDELLKIKK